MIRRIQAGILQVLLLASCSVGMLHADPEQEAWLRYARLDDAVRAKYESLPANLVVLGDSPVLGSAQSEMIRGIKGMTGKTLIAARSVETRSIVLGTLTALQAVAPGLAPPDGLGMDGFWLVNARIRGFDCLVITGLADRGVLYGVFALLSEMARGESIASLDDVQQPYAKLRWVDQWDNLNGSIERGYAGPSIFFEKGSVRADLTRAGEYARLLASVGINGCTINNVNADPRTIDDSFIPQLARIADVFRPWGVRLAVSVDLGSPKTLGKLDTFDPVDPRVISWWQDRVEIIYRQIPDFGGFVVKADSEGRAGPSSYGRTPADAANVIAHALKPHGGILFYRAFVYDHHLDWRNPKNDRARAAYDVFHPLDGKFDDNVIIQIKYGPIDFQAREPVSPLFGGLEKTNEGIELQITQEYTGQQRHLCFLPSMWKEILDFDLRVNGARTSVKDLVVGKVFHQPFGAFVGVANVGMDTNWLGHPLAIANLYGFGRLAWDPNLTAAAISEEWSRLTFGGDPVVVKTVSEMLLASWRTYENYTGPLGTQTLTDILGSHYGPGIESSERNGWGQWHRADHEGIGMDRSAATGTGFAGQYPPAIRDLYESLQTTPDELLLFFHHVPYSYRLHSGKTVIQHIYDSHYEGAEQAAEFVRQWKSLGKRMPGDSDDDELYKDVLARLEYQAGHAVLWRDAICNWFLRTSGIPDAKGRVGNYPDRVEAEAMQLKGYTSIDVTPWENASGGKGVECLNASVCTASFGFSRGAGIYELDVQYFDQNNGESKFRIFVGGRKVDEWVASDHLPATKPGGDSSTRRRIPGLALHPGDEIRIEGIPDGEEHASVDYVELHASRD
jgi:alpha-glucuronidase